MNDNGARAECEGCGEPKSTALMSRSGALADLEAARAANAALTKEVEELRAGVGEARPAEDEERWCHNASEHEPHDWSESGRLFKCAGVGEARPAEPPDDIRICLQPKHRELEAECGRLRETLKKISALSANGYVRKLAVSALRKERGDARENADG